MKRVFKNPAVMFVLGALIFSSISVYAARKYYASDITYKETTLDKALDTLYTKAKTYKNLTETTNVEANTLLSGKKAYKSDGTLVNGSIQTYSGETSVTPSNTQQVLQTSGKYMSSNITVGAMPVGSENCVSGTINTSNGYNVSTDKQVPNVNFKPSKFIIISADGTWDGLHVYNAVYNNLKIIEATPGLEANAIDFSSLYTINNNGWYIHNWPAGYNLYYIACR